MDGLSNLVKAEIFGSGEGIEKTHRGVAATHRVAITGEYWSKIKIGLSLWVVIEVVQRGDRGKKKGLPEPLGNPFYSFFVSSTYNPNKLVLP